MACGPTLHIQLLGDFRLVYDDVSVTTVNTTRLRSLLAFLLLHRNAPQSRQHLAFLFWPDSNEAQAHNNLRQSIHRLRQALPDTECYLYFDARTVQWLPDSPFTLDVADFVKAIERGDSLEALQETAGLYGGELLPGCYDDWILPERERLQQEFCAVLERLTLLLEHRGDYRSAIHQAERLLRSDPLREGTYRQLIRLYALSGDRTGAVRTYQTCVKVLKSELDVKPSPDTQAVYEASLKAPTPPASATSSAEHRTTNLPNHLTSFIGREEELAELMQLFSWSGAAMPKTRLVTLTGAGGCGKTRLATELANRFGHTFPDGVWFVDLAPLTDPALIPQAIASVLNIQEQSGRPLLDTLFRRLQSRQLLLILDNCEHLVTACAQVIQSLLHECPGLMILTTSSEKLNVMGETAWPVPPLSLPEANDLTADLASRSDAVRLFVERACSGLPTFALNADNVASIVQICQRLAGIPLAIELAAARVSTLAPAQIVARLDDAFQLLSRGGYTTRPHHQTLRATMNWSYSLLSEKERILFRRLSVFVGGFTLEAVEAVCTDQVKQGPVSRPEVLDLLSHLIDKSLVVATEWKPEQMRYRLLEPTWQYANEKLIESGESEQLGSRHLEFFLELAEEAEPHYIQAEQVRWFNRLVADHHNLMAALDRALQHGQLMAALRLTGALWYFWLARGLYTEGIGRLMQAISLTKGTTPSSARAKALRAAGALHLWSQGDLSGARPLLEEAAAASRELGDKAALAGSLNTLGITALTQGDHVAARSSLTESLALSRESDDRHTAGWSLAYLGDVAHTQRDDETAERFYAESIEQLKAIGDKNSAGYPIRRLGVLALHRGNFQQARELFEESLALNTEVDYPGGAAACLLGLAELALGQGQPLRAARLVGAAQARLDAVMGKLFPTDQVEYDRIVAALCQQLEEDSFDAARAEGRAMMAQQVGDYALQIDER